MTDMAVSSRSTRFSSWLTRFLRFPERLPKREVRRGDAVPPMSDGLTANDISQAWEELRTHPSLMWIPPMWRPVDDTAATQQIVQRRAISAVETNLIVEMRVSNEGHLVVRLATGTLTDRPVSGGIDPVVPAGSVDPNLDVSAPTFEDAVIALRDAVVKHYGSAGDDELMKNTSITAIHHRSKAV